MSRYRARHMAPNRDRAAGLWVLLAGLFLLAPVAGAWAAAPYLYVP